MEIIPKYRLKITKIEKRTEYQELEVDNDKDAKSQLEHFINTNSVKEVNLEDGECIQYVELQKLDWEQVQDYLEKFKKDF